MLSGPIDIHPVRCPDLPPAHLETLLQSARVKFTHRDPAVRREALEPAWDAFERYKTMLAGKDKKQQRKR